MIEEHDRAVLKRDLPEKGLVAGDVGSVVSVHAGEGDEPAGYTLEFFSPAGETITLATATADDVRETGEREVLHARALQ